VAEGGAGFGGSVGRERGTGMDEQSGVAGFGGSVGRERGTGMEEQLGQDWKRSAAEADMRCCGDMLKVRGRILWICELLSYCT
jgi:hypothetical protein